jgi:hypothetical protein
LRDLRFERRSEGARGKLEQAGVVFDRLVGRFFKEADRANDLAEPRAEPVGRVNPLSPKGGEAGG